MAPWTPFPHAGDYAWDATRVQQQWSQLHLGDAEPLPQDPAVLHAWALFHNGEFQKAAEAGLAAGGAGITAANKATAVYATYLEPREQTRLGLFMQIAERAQAQAAANAQHANARYWNAYALGRYCQGISVAKALAQGLGQQVKESLEKAIALSPRHVEARIALGTFHAEVIDKVGVMVGGMTYGAKKEVGLQLFEEALALHPGSAIGMVDYANALVMLEGDERMDEATALYERAAACQPMDAMEELHVAMARAELHEES